jgi:hypothetical protein
MEKKQLEGLYWLLLSVNVLVPFKSSYTAISDILNTGDISFGHIYGYLKSILLKVDVESSPIILDNIKKMKMECDEFQWCCLATICIASRSFITTRHEEIVHDLLQGLLSKLVLALFKKACMNIPISLPFIHLIFAYTFCSQNINEEIISDFNYVAKMKIENLIDSKSICIDASRISLIGKLPEHAHLQCFSPLANYFTSNCKFNSDDYDFVSSAENDCIRSKRIMKLFLFIDVFDCLNIRKKLSNYQIPKIPNILPMRMFICVLLRMKLLIIMVMV